jgi:hypothetical protein
LSKKEPARDTLAALARRFFSASAAPVLEAGARIIAKPFRLDEVLRLARGTVGGR